MKITDDLMVQALQGFEMEYDCPVFCSICIIDSFLTGGENFGYDYRNYFRFSGG